MADGTKAGEKLHASELLKEDLASVLVEEPTVMADGTKAGEKLHASELLFPPATTTTTPEFTAPSTASRIACCVPLPPRTFTLLTLAEGATPKLSPAAVPAQCVPCPCTSPAHVRSPLHSTGEPEVMSRAGTARPLNSW